MADPLRPLPVRELEGLEQGRLWDFDQPLPGLDSLTPVRGRLRARHLGTVLELEGEAATIVTLCCDRCLQHFNHPLGFQQKELLWLGAAEAFAAQEAAPHPSGPAAAPGPAGLHNGEVPVDCLDPRGSFDPGQWVYEQLCLQLPPVNRCGPHCPGPASLASGAQAGRDPRWAALGQLRPDAAARPEPAP